MNISIYRLKYSVSNYINLEYDSMTIPILTEEDFKKQYKLIGTFDINMQFVSASHIDIYKQLREKYGILIKIGDIIQHGSETYYFDVDIVKFDLL